MRAKVNLRKRFSFRSVYRFFTVAKQELPCPMSKFINTARDDERKQQITAGCRSPCLFHHFRKERGSHGTRTFFFGIPEAEELREKRRKL